MRQSVAARLALTVVLAVSMNRNAVAQLNGVNIVDILHPMCGWDEGDDREHKKKRDSMFLLAILGGVLAIGSFSGGGPSTPRSSPTDDLPVVEPPGDDPVFLPPIHDPETPPHEVNPGTPDMPGITEPNPDGEQTRSDSTGPPTSSQDVPEPGMVAFGGALVAAFFARHVRKRLRKN